MLTGTGLSTAAPEGSHTKMPSSARPVERDVTARAHMRVFTVDRLNWSTSKPCYHGSRLTPVCWLCAQYYSALEGNPRHYLMARAIQFWTPGIPMVYYVGLLAGRNDHKVIHRAQSWLTSILQMLITAHHTSAVAPLGTWLSRMGQGKHVTFSTHHGP